MRTRRMQQPAGIILAAGLSSRMGQFKPELPLNNKTLLECAVLSLQQAGVQPLFVVTGYKHETTAALARRAGAQRVHNHHYEGGMFTSLCAGIHALPPAVTAFFVLPGDMGLVRPATVRSMADALKKSPADWLVPTFQGRRGHPLLVRTHCIPQILQHDGSGGLRAVLHSQRKATQELAVPDQAILLDADTPADYSKITKLAARTPSA